MQVYRRRQCRWIECKACKHDFSLLPKGPPEQCGMWFNSYFCIDDLRNSQKPFQATSKGLGRLSIAQCCDVDAIWQAQIA